MSAVMTEDVFLNFYKSTVLGYSKNLQKYVCDLLKEKGYITFDTQKKLFDNKEKIFFESKKDWKNILEKTAMDSRCIPFYEYWEFIKLYKYSVPFFYEIPDKKICWNLSKAMTLLFLTRMSISRNILSMSL